MTNPTNRASRTVGIVIAVIGALGAIVAAWVQTTSGRPSEGPVALSSSPSSLPLPFRLEAQFHPSGWMGDGEFGAEHLSLRSLPAEVQGAPEIATRFEYRAGPKKWAGIYWQHPDNNWGNEPGLDLTGAHRITFMAKGTSGSEIVEFKAGGTTGSHPDSFHKSLGKVVLTTEWRSYVIDLSGEKLSNVVGAFAWVAAAPDNPSPLIFFLARLTVE